MPAPQRYPAPHEQLLTLAQAAKRDGLSFEEFWERAVPPPSREPGELEEDERLVPDRDRRLPLMGDPDAPEGAVLWPRDSYNRSISYYGVVTSREGWRRAYEGMTPEPRESALNILSPLPRDGKDLGAEVHSAA